MYTVKFRYLVSIVWRYSPAQINNIQPQVQTQSDNASTSITTFQSFLEQQPEYVQRLLGTLKAEEVGPDYWINAISDGQ
eukprot:3553875-Ditylum_brightwellii.AAC.1